MLFNFLKLKWELKVKLIYFHYHFPFYFRKLSYVISFCKGSTFF